MRSILVVLTTTADPLLQYEEYSGGTLSHIFVMSDVQLVLQVTQTFRPDLLVLPERLAGMATDTFVQCFHHQPGLARVPVRILTDVQSATVLDSFSVEPPDLQRVLPLLAEALSDPSQPGEQSD